MRLRIADLHDVQELLDRPPDVPDVRPTGGHGWAPSNPLTELRTHERVEVAGEPLDPISPSTVRKRAKPYEEGHPMVDAARLVRVRRQPGDVRLDRLAEERASDAVHGARTDE